MHVDSNILHTVVFLGYDDSTSASGFACEGSGFLIHYKNQGYLITARHVASKLGSDPFSIRVNQKGMAVLVDSDNTDWTFHLDPTVDIAVTRVALGRRAGFESQYLDEKSVLTKERLDAEGIGIGDFSYVVGLFHFVHGHSRNLPMLYTGHVSLLPPEGEKIPVGNEQNGETEWVEAYLVECSAINGASGSPVFVRSAITQGPVRLNSGAEVRMLVPEAKIFLLGLFQAAWFLPPDDPLRKNVHARKGDVVPVGLGVVVPAYKIIEVLEDPKLAKERATLPALAARNVSVSSREDVAPPATDTNSKPRDGW